MINERQDKKQHFEKEILTPTVIVAVLSIFVSLLLSLLPKFSSIVSYSGYFELIPVFYTVILLSILTILLSMLTFVGFYIRLRLRETEREINRGESIEGKLNDIQRSIRENTNQKAIIDKKKKIFLNIPFIDIHYANADKIREIYYGFINELIRKKVVTETTNKKSGEAKAGYGGIGGKLSGDSSNKTVSEYEAPGISLDDMFLSVQTKTITQNQVRLGIEEVNIELTELQAFEQDIENLKKRYNFIIADGQVNEKNSELREKAAQRTLDNLEKVAGKVLVKGNFKIEADGDSYKYVYTHPVNEYITDKAEHVIISVRIPKNSLAPDFQTLYEKSLGESRPLNIYGSVWRPISRKDNIWEFQIKPLAVYSC